MAADGARSQGISSHDMDLFVSENTGFSTRKVTIFSHGASFTNVDYL